MNGPRRTPRAEQSTVVPADDHTHIDDVRRLRAAREVSLKFPYERAIVAHSVAATQQETSSGAQCTTLPPKVPWSSASPTRPHLRQSSFGCRHASI